MRFERLAKRAVCMQKDGCRFSGSISICFCFREEDETCTAAAAAALSSIPHATTSFDRHY